MHPAALTSPCGVQACAGKLRRGKLIQVELLRGKRPLPRNASAMIFLALPADANEDSATCVRTSARASNLA